MVVPKVDTDPPFALLKALCHPSTTFAPPALSTALALNTYSPSERYAGIESDVDVPGPNTFPPGSNACTFPPLANLFPLPTTILPEPDPTTL